MGVGDADVDLEWTSCGHQNWTGSEGVYFLGVPNVRCLAGCRRIAWKLFKNADNWVSPSEIPNQKTGDKINKSYKVQHSDYSQ